MNVDWMAVQNRLTAAEAALKRAENDVSGLIVIVAGLQSAISSLCIEAGGRPMVGLGTLNAVLAKSLSPETLKRFEELETEGIKQRKAV